MDSQPRSLPHKKWWVFFVKTDWHRNWWYHLFPRYRAPFQHVYAACEVTNNIIMYLDPQMNGAAVSLMNGRPKDHIRFVLRSGGRVLYLERPDWHDEMTSRDLKYRRGWTITCASFIAYHMGLDTRVQSPWGFYDLLLRDYGAIELERTYERRRRGSEPEIGRASGADAGG